MKAASLACLLLIFFSTTVFGHGVERGSIWKGINSSELSFLAESTKEDISEAVESRCNLTGMISATAEIEEPASAFSPNGFRIRIRVSVENSETPAIIIVRAVDKGLSATGEGAIIEYTVDSPLCR